MPVIEDWAAAEYGLTSEELDRAAENLLKAGAKLLRTGKTLSWNNFKNNQTRS